jgi:hypothetical protein
MRSRSQPHAEPELVRRNLIIVLIASIIVSSSLVIFSNTTEAKTLYSDIIEPLATLTAVGLASLVVYRQKLDGLIGKVYASLAIGLVLWFIAEVIWSYYEVVMGIEIPTPSPADALWLIGYAPFMYYIFRMFRFFNRSPNRYDVIIVSIAAAIYLIFIIDAALEVSDFSAQNSIIKFFVNIAYPILDVILIVPAALMILDSARKDDGGRRSGKLVSIPWIFLSFIIITIADSGFVYSSNAGWRQDIIWIWTPFYISGYLVMAAGLFWHNRFFVFDEKKAVKRWQQEHR